MAKINPFRPNSPIHSGMFVGRVDELKKLENALTQTKAGIPTNFMVTGERGIGKSSLLNYIKNVAQAHHTGIVDTDVSFLVVDTDIDPNTTQLGLVKKLELAITRALGATEPARQFLKTSWEFLKRVEAHGFKLGAAQKTENEELLMEEFSYTLAEICNRLCSPDRNIFATRYDGILILIDEADNASAELSLGSFFKLLTERLLRRGCVNVAFGIAGLPELRNVLAESHPSALRLFEELILGRLTTQEVDRVISAGLKDAKEKNPLETKITAEARQHLAYYSEGYPHFIQQFASSAFSVDTDNVIAADDIKHGGFGRRGALELIGDRYYRDNFYKVQKESYRQVLRIMAEKLDDWVSKAEIKAKFSGQEKTLANALFSLRERKIILAKEGERGVYRLQHKGFAWWIKLYTQDPTIPGPTVS
jgi:Cdc6-like AAA superfamily ATPase